MSTPYIRPPPNWTMLYQTPPGLTYGATHTQYSTICKQNAYPCTTYTHIPTTIHTHYLHSYTHYNTYTAPIWYPPTFQYRLITNTFIRTPTRTTHLPMVNMHNTPFDSSLLLSCAKGEHGLHIASVQ